MARPESSKGVELSLRVATPLAGRGTRNFFKLTHDRFFGREEYPALAKGCVVYPENLPDVLQTTRARFEQEAKMAMAVMLFEMRRLSSWMAAALVGMDRVSFLLRLSDFGVPMIDFDAEELAKDIVNA